MSEILRVTKPRREVAIAGVTTLAKLCHQAEDEGDDILFLEVVDEAHRRGDVENEIFRREYNRIGLERCKK